MHARILAYIGARLRCALRLLMFSARARARVCVCVNVSMHATNDDVTTTHRCILLE